jgi:hypothetical protein
MQPSEGRQNRIPSQRLTFERNRQQENERNIRDDYDEKSDEPVGKEGTRLRRIPSQRLHNKAVGGTPSEGRQHHNPSQRLTFERNRQQEIERNIRDDYDEESDEPVGKQGTRRCRIRSQRLYSKAIRDNSDEESDEATLTEVARNVSRQNKKGKRGRIPSQRLPIERKRRQEIKHFISDDDDEEIDDTLFTKVENINISVRTALLMWPIRATIGGDFMTMTPISPPFNRRDVGESRLTVEVKANIIEGSPCDAMFGCVEPIEQDCAKYDSVRMASIFCRYTKQCRNGSDYFSNIGADKHEDLTCRIQTIVSLLSVGNTIQHNKVVKNRKANVVKALDQKPLSPTRLLIRFMLLLDKAYSGFNSRSSYEKLIVLLDNLADHYKQSLTFIRGASVELNATLTFQSFMNP